MLKHKNYIDIMAANPDIQIVFNPGDEVIITCKLDGANSSVQYDPECEVQSFSRKTILTESNNNRGFYQLAKTFNIEKLKEYDKLRFFGEYLTKHRIKYPDDKKDKFYLFDIFNTVNSAWLLPDEVMTIGGDCGFEFVPIFYRGPFISWEHVMEFVGKSGLGEEQGEGIVIKNITTMKNADTKIPFVTKIVRKEFKESMMPKQRKPQTPVDEHAIELTKSIVTPARIEKLLYKMIDESLLEENWDSSCMANIAKHLPLMVYEDCVKEENDIVQQVDTFGKISSKLVMQHVKKLLTDRNL